MFHLIVRDRATRQRPQTTTFEEKGEPKRIQSEAQPAHIRPFSVAIRPSMHFSIHLLLVSGSRGFRPRSKP